MDLTTARLEVRERIGELEADFFTDAEVDRAINEAVRRLSSSERWPWLLTEGTDALGNTEFTLDLPDGVAYNRVENVSISGGSLLTPRILELVSSHEGFRLRHVRALFSSGPPLYYYITSASIEAGSEVRYVLRFVPEADDDYDVEYLYYRVPEDLSAGADLVDVPQEYADAVPAWAAGKLFLKEHAVSQKASEQFAIYQAIVEEARQEHQEATMDEIIAAGREHPGENRAISEYDYVISRIGGDPLG